MDSDAVESPVDSVGIDGQSRGKNKTKNTHRLSKVFLELIANSRDIRNQVTIEPCQTCQTQTWYFELRR